MISLPRLLCIRGGARREIGSALDQFGIRRPLLITDKFMVKAGHAGELVDLASDVCPNMDVFDETVPEPTSYCLEHALNVFRQGGYDGIVALGGGSPIDLAKAVSVIGHDDLDLSKYRAPNNPAPGYPVVALPTTAGTGSEVTKATVITDSKTHEKILCMAPAFQPVAALVDYEYTMSCPKTLTSHTGLDALTHAIESYVSRKRNGFSDALALAAMGAIGKHIRTVCTEPTNRTAREAMMLGATQAGMAFSNASVALVHGMARPLGAHFGIPHGLSNAMLLPVVTGFSVQADVARYADCARAMGIDVQKGADLRAVELLLEELVRLNHDLRIPTPKQYGVDHERYFRLVPLMVDQAIASGSPGNNPRIATASEMFELYTDAYTHDEYAFA
ncbi:Alcohol dehydrogenase iron-type/glycerol dehydrogenase GldA domain-containing protein [Plasmodiophora brassicae]